MGRAPSGGLGERCLKVVGRGPDGGPGLSGDTLADRRVGGKLRETGGDVGDVGGRGAGAPHQRSCALVSLISNGFIYCLPN